MKPLVYANIHEFVEFQHPIPIYCLVTFFVYIVVSCGWPWRQKKIKLKRFNQIQRQHRSRIRCWIVGLCVSTELNFNHKFHFISVHWLSVSRTVSVLFNLVWITLYFQLIKSGFMVFIKRLGMRVPSKNTCMHTQYDQLSERFTLYTTLRKTNTDRCDHMAFICVDFFEIITHFTHSFYVHDTNDKEANKNKTTNMWYDNRR